MDPIDGELRTRSVARRAHRGDLCFAGVDIRSLHNRHDKQKEGHSERFFHGTPPSGWSQAPLSPIIIPFLRLLLSLNYPFAMRVAMEHILGKSERKARSAQVSRPA